MLVNKEANIHNSLAIRSIAKYLILIESESCLEELAVFLENHNEKVLVLGEATNVVLPNYFDGIIVKTMLNDTNYISSNEVITGSSVNWDAFISWTLDNNLHGLENLTLIPGSVGAAPIQNIGAYGIEVCDFIKSVRFFDLTTNSIKEFDNSECKFGYRTSIFQSMHIIILSVTFKFLSKPVNINYASIQDYLDTNNINKSSLTPKDLSLIVKKIRTSKLPNPSTIPNVGSFFKNPVVQKSSINTDCFSYDDLIIWSIDQNQVKVGAARLLELIDDLIPKHSQVELYKDHSLVLINKGNASQEDIINFSQYLQNKVFETFNIQLNVEPLIIKS
ncbi:MAG: UDP-N-acetylmuramate dehydrogenase [SAR86 cluster bacterium]|uniref:UDP-N-acetylenolpyruvoylglucosamine reductase n=1 Tax=SAR86 cluster bacterium TaxID=2030880 RepID=A0A937JAJ6_9GAMM|nr:UDP-N-acetylmuramate dehydrogenase [SAR86 cluster bacterium]